MENEKITIPAEFSDICPIADKDFHNEMTILIQEPAFQHIISLVMPEYKYSQLVHVLLSLNSKREFQTKIMKPFIEGVSGKDIQRNHRERNRELRERRSQHVHHQSP